jgi:ankyrin repeat protein
VSDTALHLAVRAGDVNMTQVLLNYRANPNINNSSGRSAVDEALQSPQAASLLQALVRGNADLRPTRYIDSIFESRNFGALNLLLDAGGDANHALRRAEAAGNDAVFARVIQGYQVNADDALFKSAVSNKRYTMAKLVLDSGSNSLDINQALAVAIENDAPQIVEAALVKGAGANPVLPYAVRKGNRMLAQRALMEFRADPNVGVELGVSSNDLALARTALDLGGDPNRGITAASAAGNEPIVTELLSRKANPNLGLKVAAENKHDRVVEALVTAGADPNPAMPYAAEQNNVQLVGVLLRFNANGRPPGLMASAAKHGNRQMVDLLLAAGGSATAGMFNAVQRNDIELTRHLLASGGDAKSSSDFIMVAVGNNSRPVVDLLLGAGASVDHGLTAAVREGKDDLTRLFVSKGADVKPPVYIEDLAGRGKLDLVTLFLDGGANAHPGLEPAIMGGHVEVARLLLTRGNPACPTPGCGKLLQVATALNNPRTTMLLLDYGADPTAAVSAALACQPNKPCDGQEQSLDALIQAGADVSEPDLIAFSVTRNSLRVVQKLITAGAALEGRDPSGQPLIHIAMLRQDPALMRLLLDRGADPNAANKAGDTALHILARDANSTGYPAFRKMERARLPLADVLLSARGINVNAGNAAGEPPLRRVDGGYIKDRLEQIGAIREIARTPQNCLVTPTLYENNLFQGKSIAVTEESSDLKVQDFRNKASSLCVPKGWTLVVFEKPAFQGATYTINGPTVIYHMQDQRPGGQSWNDRVGSVKVSRQEPQ